MRKVLIVVVESIARGGVEAYLTNMLEHMELDGFCIDIFIPNYIVDPYFSERWRSCGCTVYEGGVISRKPLFYVELLYRLSRTLKEGRYDVIHSSQCGRAMMAATILAARLQRVPCRIAHAHLASEEREGFIKSLFLGGVRRSIAVNATDLVGCSRAANIWMYGKKAGETAHIAKNGIDTARFAFNQAVRDEVRQRLNLENCFVIGHVGRFAEQKNHRFLIQIFRQIVEHDSSARLLLIGEGPLENEIHLLVNQYQLNEKVLFIGVTGIVENYMCAMDVFVLPSLFEGLGIVNIEAQASGLPCIVSDVVPQEAKLTGRLEFLPLQVDVDVWAEKILQYHPDKYCPDREKAWREVYDAGYDISDTAQVIQKLYEDNGKKRS